MHTAFGGGTTPLDALREKLNRRDTQAHGFHSAAYHAFFQGYTEYRMLDARGHIRIRRVYTGPVYEQKLPLAAQIALRLAYLIMTALLAECLILVAQLDRGSDTWAPLILLELVTLIVLSLLGYTVLVEYLFAPRRMTVGTWRGASRGLYRKALLLAGCMAADALVNLVRNLTSEAAASDWHAVLLFMAGAVMALGMAGIEHAVPYSSTEGTEKASDDPGVEIG